MLPYVPIVVNILLHACLILVNSLGNMQDEQCSPFVVNEALKWCVTEGYTL